MTSKQFLAASLVAAGVATLSAVGIVGGFIGVVMWGTVMYAHKEGVAFAPVELIACGVAAVLFLLSAATFFVPLLVVGLRFRARGNPGIAAA